MTVTADETAWKRYPEYKDSGVEWIGEIPVGWEVKRIKWQLTQIDDKIPSSDCQLDYIGMENIESGTGKLIETDSEVDGQANRFRRNDILFGKLRPYLNKVHRANTDGLCSTEFLVYRNGGGFEEYSLRSRGFIAYVNASTYGAKMPRANGAWVSNQLLPIPPKSEQTAIADFLDEKTAKIDEAIRQKERMIALLEERKQIVIQSAVTKGLDPDVPMKDSGVEWIGDIPAHWEVRRVKSIFRLVIDPAEKNNAEELLSIYTHIGVEPRRDLEEKGNKASTTDGYWRVRKGDFIVNKLLAWMGAIGLSKYDGVTSPAYDILRPMVRVNGWFYHFLFRSKPCSQELKKHSRGIMEMRLRLYFDRFGNVLVPFPTAEEQDVIVEELDSRLNKLRVGGERIESQIQTLREYRATLIDSAVTGKIDVSGRGRS